MWTIRFQYQLNSLLSIRLLCEFIIISPNLIFPYCYLISSPWRLDDGNIVETLLKYGSNINAENEDKNTPLHVAAGNGDEKIVDILLKNGANINPLNKDKNTPLHLATMKSKSKFIII